MGYTGTATSIQFGPTSNPPMFRFFSCFIAQGAFINCNLGQGGLPPMGIGIATPGGTFDHHCFSQAAVAALGTPICLITHG